MNHPTNSPAVTYPELLALCSDRNQGRQVEQQLRQQAQQAIAQLCRASGPDDTSTPVPTPPEAAVAEASAAKE